MTNGTMAASRYLQTPTKNVDTVSQSPTPRKILGLKSPVRPKWAVLEYRLVWREPAGQWEIYRNGVKTSSARRKKQSAVDLAILAIGADKSLAGAKARVLSVRDGQVRTEWERQKPLGSP